MGSEKCEICGKKFTWFWRHRYNCIICKDTICSDCYVTSHLPAMIMQLQFDEVKICKKCIQQNLSELKKKRLDEVVKIYSKAREVGYNDGYGDHLNQQKYYEVKELAIEHPNEIAIHAFKQGYADGHEEGKTERLRDEEREGEEREKENK